MLVDHRLKLSLVMGVSQDKSKGKGALVIPKCRSTSILRTRFANTRKNKGEDSGPKVVMTVDADESDEGAAVKTKIGACKQDSDSLDEDLDEDQHHDHDGGMHTDPDTHPEELDSPIMPFESAIDHGQRIVTESVMPIADDSSDVGLDFSVTVIGTLLVFQQRSPLAPLHLGTPNMAANTVL